MDGDKTPNSDDEEYLSDGEPQYKIFYDENEIKETKINQ